MSPCTHTMQGRRGTAPASALLAIWLLACADGAVEPTPALPPNRAPVAVDSIPARTLVAGATATVDVSAYFADPDGDTLTFTAASSDERIATIAVSGSTVTVAAAAEGMTSVTVAGRDGAGLQAIQSFAVTVTVPNRAPVLLDSLPTRFMLVDETVELDVSPYFADPDEDVLSYASASSDTAVVGARVSGNSVTLVAAALGMAAVTITARDPAALEASQSFAVRVDSVRSVVTLAHTAVALPEGTRAVLEVVLSEAPSSPISVAYSLGADTDPATADADTADFGMATGTIEIGAGQAGAWLEITVDDDTDIEPVREVFTVVLDKPQRGGAYEIGSASAATVTILEGVCDRTQKVREAIVALAPTDRCSGIDVAHLAAITSLDLRRGSITSLQSRDFQGLSNLETLRLSANWIAELPQGVFSGLTRLEHLGLDNNNELSELPPGVFSGLSSLRWLNLLSNGLTTLPDGVFSGLSGLSRLGLTGNDLTELPEGVFSGLSTLEHLSLGYNQLTGLPPLIFAGLSSLKSLGLAGNQMVELPPGVFSGLSSLEGLELRTNALSVLPRNLFSGLTSLEGLALDDNRLTELPAGIFLGLSSLTSVSLNGNRFSALPAGLFSDLASLTWLHLGGNQLVRLPVGLFSGLTSLERLHLEQNQLATLEAGIFSSLSSLRELNLNQNRLEELPEGVFSGLSSLILLNLTENQLSRLPAGMFKGLSALRAVGLLDNPGAPFALILEVRRTDSGNPMAQGPATVAVRLAEGTPLTANVVLSAVGGALSGDQVLLSVGEEWSSEVTVTQAADARLPTRVEVKSVPRIHPGSGITFRAGDPLILFGGSPNPGD